MNLSKNKSLHLAVFIVLFTTLSCAIANNKSQPLYPDNSNLTIEKINYEYQDIRIDFIDGSRFAEKENVPIIKTVVAKIKIEKPRDEVSIKKTHFGTGRVSWFGGPKETPREGKKPCFLYPKKKVGKLDPDSFYCAIRFNKGQRERFKKASIRIEKVDKKGNTVDSVENVKIVDWGPSKWTNKIIDVSPGILEELDIRHGDKVKVILVEGKKC